MVDWCVARVLLACIGSYGDINPYLAIGRELQRRKHRVVLAAPAFYSGDAARENLEFAALRPWADPADTALLTRALHPRMGPQFIVRDFIMPRIGEMYEDLERAASGADLLVSHMLTYALPIFAEKKRIPWVSSVLQPLVFFSAHDPPVLAPAPWLAALRPLGPGFHAFVFRALRLVSYSWGNPVRTLRRELGLPLGKDPLFEGQHSPRAVLALFSGLFGPPQPDWPAQARVCGFPFHDEDFGGKGLDPRLEAFLDSGEPPVAFTLGSSAVRLAGDFYAWAASAARGLRRRAVLLAGPGADALSALPKGMIAAASAPYHILFPRCMAIVHSGGIGTTAQALRAGRPQLIVPFSHDQFDNAARVKRLGAGRRFDFSGLDAMRLERALRPVLGDPSLSRNAAVIGEAVRAENGVRNACDEIEAVLPRNRQRRP